MDEAMEHDCWDRRWIGGWGSALVGELCPKQGLFSEPAACHRPGCHRNFNSISEEQAEEGRPLRP